MTEAPSLGDEASAKLGASPSAPRLTFRQNAHIEIVPDEGVYLLSERQQMVLSGALYTLIAPLLDGQFAADEIVARLADTADPAAVYYAIARLQRQGHVVATDETMAPERAAFWIDLGLDPPSAEARLQSAVVSLVGVGRVPLDEARSALSFADICIGEDGDLALVLADDYLRPELADLNRAMLAAGRPWLLVKPLGTVPWIGPLFRPGPDRLLELPRPTPPGQA